jgi:hypothetical protein
MIEENFTDVVDAALHRHQAAAAPDKRVHI